ncbi:Crp/Fnr family transcriptional regulator [Hirschia maritima]|uniref:Crp/Fnr family transcriptional regulator n=1 Tax=Hirschia maritima TaxID=1121961 RepID=UPI00037595AB|nr:Crp/Fnr family transcriptional regulator [Hirschia maritima]
MDLDIDVLLKNDTWLANIPTKVRAEFVSNIRVKNVAPETIIFSEGDEPTAFLGLLSGEVGIRKYTFDGDESLLTKLTPVHWFGEMSFLDGQPRTHTAIALSEVTLAMVNRTDVQRMLKDHSSLFQAFVMQLCHHTRLLYSAVDDFMLMSPERLLAKRMLELLQQSKHDQSVECSQDELARLVGVSRQSINRTLSRWESRGLIERGYGKINVLSKQAIERVLAGQFGKRS